MYHLNVKYKGKKEVIVFPSRYKTLILGAPKMIKNRNNKIKKMSGAQRKKWAVEKAGYIFSLRKDIKSLSELNSRKKKDDPADAIVMLQAYKVMIYYDKIL